MCVQGISRNSFCFHRTDGTEGKKGRVSAIMAQIISEGNVHPVACASDEPALLQATGRSGSARCDRKCNGCEFEAGCQV